MEKKDPVAFLADNWPIISETYNKNDNRPKKTWEVLEEDLPELSQTMSFSTFKQYLNVCLHVFKEWEGMKRDMVAKILRKEERLRMITHGLHETKRELDRRIQEKVIQEQEIELVTQRLHKCESELSSVRNELDGIKGSMPLHRLHKVTQDGDDSPLSQQSPPKQINGWSLQKAKDGYYRLHKKIKGRVHSIYVGKVVDVNTVKEKIAKKEKLLGLHNS